MILFAALLAFLLLGACAYLQHPKFGAYPAGEHLEKIERSPHYANGSFHYPLDTPVLREGVGMGSIIAGNLLDKAASLRPSVPLPTVKTDLKALSLERDAIVWLGHSSYFVVFAGRRLLIDPVLSAYAAPVSFSTQAFAGTNLYTADDLPPIDVLLITHDHWDHLDYATVTALRDKVSQVLVPLGVGAHFERWGYPPEKIREADWYDSLSLDRSTTLHLIPARHYSGRLLTRNKTLWSGFVLASDRRRILFSGDTGYGPHFAEIAQRFGSFDLVALDMGQYDPRWPYIHMTPEDAAQAAEDLHAKVLLPAHVGRFTIARHAWNEPFERIRAASQTRPYTLLTPMIGQPLMLDDAKPVFAPWWEPDTTSSQSPISLNAPGASS
ncbi:MAG: MBL fold metallo-hydrolase [Proteobacteria bacterium]|nr:MBL fold metallo-hydrolase [Pseudomonadota bacterium]